jgi:hypothetical protein
MGVGLRGIFGKLRLGKKFFWGRRWKFGGYFFWVLGGEI